MPALKPKARADLTFVPIEDEAILYDPEAVRLHHLNPSAALIFQLCDGSGTVKELARDIAEELELPHDEILNQVRSVVNHFRHSGILDGRRRKSDGPSDEVVHVGHTHGHDGHAHEGHAHG